MAVAQTHPYQCLNAIPLAKNVGSAQILAACYNQLILIDTGGNVFDCWPREDSKDEDADSDSSTEIITASADGSNGERPRKQRRKSTKQAAERQGSPLTALNVSDDGSHAVATTGEDKAIHVFSLKSKDQILHLSQRHMTKRPCAIAFSKNGQNILVGDKFGDVYALPLHHDPSAAQAGAKPSKTSHKPAATNLTVHSKRNLTALENQQRQAANPQQPGKEREAMTFEHELLLGHVSMLTDLVTATCQTPHGHQEYIVTADRDEHIRISRGQPQAHIIENYCFGHTSFVSNLCLAREDILISGGGDDYLLVWDWRRGKLLTKLDIRKAICQHSQSLESEAKPPTSIAVSTLRAQLVESTTGRIAIFCACEAIAAIVVFQLDVAQPLGDVTEPLQLRQLPSEYGNVLDLAVIGSAFRDGRLKYEVVVSLDSLHRPYSKEVREGAGVRLAKVTNDDLSILPGHPVEASDDAMKQSVDLFYGREKLRKKGGDDD